MDLTVLNYILPAHDDDLIIYVIDSYGKEFWSEVDAILVFKNNISDKFKTVLKKYNIKFEINPNGLWLSVMHDLVKNCKTKYISIFFEDILITNKDAFINTFKEFEYNDLDFLITYCFDLWGKVAKTLAENKLEVVENDDYYMFQWGSKESKFCEHPLVKSSITTSLSTPYPISLGGIFKKDLFLETATRQMASETWKNMEKNNNYYLEEDWAKDPRKPHAYEVYWVHNKTTEIIEYIMLVPKRGFTKGIDPKDNYREHLE